jgi:hypothetical protein
MEVLTDHLQRHRQMALVSGPGQVGKTTARRSISDTYLNWDNSVTGGTCCVVQRHWPKPCSWTSFEDSHPSQYSMTATRGRSRRWSHEPQSPWTCLNSL